MRSMGTQGGDAPHRVKIIPNARQSLGCVLCGAWEREMMGFTDETAWFFLFDFRLLLPPAGARRSLRRPAAVPATPPCSWSACFLCLGRKGFVFLMLASIALNYGIGRWLEARNRRLVLVLGIVLNLVPPDRLQVREFLHRQPEFDPASADRSQADPPADRDFILHVRGDRIPRRYSPPRHNRPAEPGEFRPVRDNCSRT